MLLYQALGRNAHVVEALPGLGGDGSSGTIKREPSEKTRSNLLQGSPQAFRPLLRFSSLFGNMLRRSTEPCPHSFLPPQSNGSGWWPNLQNRGPNKPLLFVKLVYRIYLLQCKKTKKDLTRKRSVFWFNWTQSWHHSYSKEQFYPTITR